MYNFIVSGNGESWKGQPFILDKSRVGEYTDGSIAAKYRPMNDDVLRELQAFPCLFAYEDHVKADARLGYITRVLDREGEIRIEYEFYPGLPPIPSSELARLEWELEIGSWEMNRTHWAFKSAELLPVLLEARLLTPGQVSGLPAHVVRRRPGTRLTPIVVTPSVFELVEQAQDADLVSVMMPFSRDFDEVYATIRASCKDADLRCLRADDIWKESTIIQDVFNLLYRSRIVVVDFTGRNPNVLYETGIAHTLGRAVVPVSQSMDDVPFDLRHHRVLKYFPTTDGLASMRTSLAKRLITLAE